ncbi:MAG: recombinase family protein [Lachnospiraceae bacterium]|nr:recombinase family protein [Lachnospiraceae bacterium]
MVYGYARVSTKGQAKDGNSLESQEMKLKENGAEKIYIDSFTGTKIDRPQLAELMNKIQSGDTLVVTKLDRFARSVSQASQLITDLIDKGIRVNVLNLGILDNSSMSTLMRNILLSFAQFERDMIVERTQEGKEIARRREDFREGRPKKYGKKQIEHALHMLENISYKQVEYLTAISKSTLIRAKRRSI